MPKIIDFTSHQFERDAKRVGWERLTQITPADKQRSRRQLDAMAWEQNKQAAQSVSEEE